MPTKLQIVIIFEQMVKLRNGFQFRDQRLKIHFIKEKLDKKIFDLKKSFGRLPKVEAQTLKPIYFQTTQSVKMLKHKC